MRERARCRLAVKRKNAAVLFGLGIKCNEIVELGRISRLSATRQHRQISFGCGLSQCNSEGSSAEIEDWIRDAESSGIYAMQRFAQTIQRDIEAIRNAIITPWSNGQTEGQINRLKALKRSMYGRAGTELLRARMLPIATTS